MLMAEAISQCPEPATHIYLQAGVGGLAAACAVMARQAWGDAPEIVVVEPTRRSLGTAAQIKKLANDIGLKRLYLVGNKVRNADEQAFPYQHALPIASQWTKRDILSRLRTESLRKATVTRKTSGLLVRDKERATQAQIGL